MTFDRITEALGAGPRRRILVALLDESPVDQSATLLADGGGSEERRELELVHNHLPKLDDLGYIVWDRDHGTVLKGGEWEEIEPVVRLLAENREQLPPDAF